MQRGGSTQEDYAAELLQPGQNYEMELLDGAQIGIASCAKSASGLFDFCVHDTKGHHMNYSRQHGVAGLTHSGDINQHGKLLHTARYTASQLDDALVPLDRRRVQRRETLLPAADRR